ncbi:MAG: AI-2E family transporter [Lachnospiraceae bacterium]|nr:AI-2E family transporter [Lachnospiraceae bacterium]
MKIEWKSCWRVGVSIFLLYLAITYWSVLAHFCGVFFRAAAPLMAGGIIAYLVNILMGFYERHYFPKKKRKIVEATKRVVCMLLAFLTLVLIVAMVGYLVIPELKDSILLLMEGLPDVIAWLADSDTLNELLPQEIMQKLATIDWEKTLQNIVQFLWSGVGSVVGTVANAISSFFSVAMLLVLGIIFAIYLLLGKEQLGGQAKRMLQNYLPKNWFAKLMHVLSVMDDSFRHYVVGQCIEAIILGLLCAIGMLIFRLPYAAMIGTLIGFTALVPVAGAYIGGAVGVVLIMTVSPMKALIFLIFLVVLQQLEGNLIYPKVVGSSIGLPGIWVLAAVTVGGSLMGIAGMLLGVPVAATLYRLLQENLHQREAVNAGKAEEALAEGTECSKSEEAESETERENTSTEE